jgi:tRNA pseudouridine55 synthase
MHDQAAPSGLLLIDKPAGITSFDIIRRLRRQLGVRKIGHAGTLDPMATGLMLMLIGAATKQATGLIKLDKTYIARITLGAVSDTGDAEGRLTAVSTKRPSRSAIEGVLAARQGQTTQIPPAYSAIKVGGVRSYKLAREGRAVELAARPVTIHRLELQSYEYPCIELVTAVSSGTYIRSLATDIGNDLETGGYLSGLRRQRVGVYDVAQAVTIDQVTPENVKNYLMKLEQS